MTPNNAISDSKAAPNISSDGAITILVDETTHEGCKKL